MELLLGCLTIYIVKQNYSYPRPFSLAAYTRAVDLNEVVKTAEELTQPVNLLSFLSLGR